MPYDAVSSFKLLPASASPFSYGYRVGSGAFSQYDSTTAACAGIGGLACNYSSASDNNNLPAVGKNATGAQFHSGTVNVPTDVLFMHPGSGPPNAEIDSIVRFIAPAAGTYFVTGLFETLDDTPQGHSVLP